MPEWIWNLLLGVLLKASPEIKILICDKLEELAIKAKETRNPFDDMLIRLLQGMVGCEKK